MFVVNSCMRYTNTSKNILCAVRFFSNSAPRNQVARSFLRGKTRSEEIGPFGYCLLIIPATTFALGTWQVQRKKWKENLIADLKSRSSSDPVPLPNSLEEIENLEYYPVYVKGKFLHDKELYMGPRSLLTRGDASTESSLMSKRQTGSQGFLVITPFKLADRDETILVNRGWVPSRNKDPRTRLEGQVSSEVNVVGIVRLNEIRPTFMPANKDGAWYYRDLKDMCNVTGASPIYLDATNDFDAKGGPIGGQTRISLRNEHLSYIFTWYTLSALTGFAWFKQFIKPK